MAARAELGPEYDDAIAAGLADRVEELVAYRTAELRHADEGAKEDRADLRRGNSHRFVLGIVSLGAGIPISANLGRNHRSARSDGRLGGHRRGERRLRPGVAADDVVRELRRTTPGLVGAADPRR